MCGEALLWKTVSGLTLNGDSTIQLGDEAGSQSIFFTDSIWNGGTLSILNWSDTPQSDQVRFQVEPSPDFLGSVEFDGFANGALWVNGAIVPIPEPSAAAMALLGLIGSIAIQNRRRNDHS